MKKFKHFVIGGIENKIFNLVIITIMLILAAYGIVLFVQTNMLTKLLTETTEKQKESISAITSQTMDGVLQTSLTKQTLLEAYLADATFSSLQSQVKMLSDYATKLYSDPENAPSEMPLTPDQFNSKELSAQLLFADGVNLEEDGLEEEAELIGNMSGMLTSLFNSTSINACYITTSTGLTLIADDRPESKLGDDGIPVTVDGRTRPWYVGALKDKDIHFTDVEEDYFTGEIGIQCSAPVIVDGKIVAVVGADLFLDSMSQAVISSDTDTGFTFIINENGKVIFSPRTDGELKVESSDVANDLRNSSNETLAAFVKDALEGNTGVHEVQANGKGYYMTGAYMNTVGWSVVDVVDKTAIEMPEKMMLAEYQKTVDETRTKLEDNTQKGKITILILIGTVLVLGTANTIVLSKRIVRPLNLMSKKVQEISGENLDFELLKEYKTGDEIEVLADSFSNLSARTKAYIAENMRINKEKERISAELNVATQIQADMLPRIFPAFPERKEFDLYASMDPAKEVGGDFYDFFLIDDDHLCMVMADVSGKGVPAALFMVIAKTLIKNRAQMGGSPAEILHDVNNQLCEGNEAELFVTVWMAILTISTGKGIAANAGHEHPALKRKDGKYELVVYRHSPALAVMPNVNFKEHEFALEPGDALFVYTDGVAEATDAKEELFGSERLVNALNQNPEAGPEEVLSTMQKSISDFVGTAPQFDDITMLSLTYIGPGEADDK